MATNYTLTMPRRTMRFADRLHMALGHVLTWYARSRERRTLAELDERMLRDIGISAAEAHAEAHKPFWAR